MIQPNFNTDIDAAPSFHLYSNNINFKPCWYKITIGRVWGSPGILPILPTGIEHQASQSRIV